MQKSSIKQLNTKEIDQINGGHNTGDHHHFFGHHHHEIVFALTIISFGMVKLYTTKPRLARGITMFGGMATIGIIAYKILVDNPDSEEKKQDL